MNRILQVTSLYLMQNYKKEGKKTCFQHLFVEKLLKNKTKIKDKK